MSWQPSNTPGSLSNRCVIPPRRSAGTSTRPPLRLVLPVGISFYTFQTLSYTIDVYRGRSAPCRSILNFALYVAFFPQLVAGPIERAGDLLPQFSRAAQTTTNDFAVALWWITLGYFKKIYVADNLAGSVDPVFDAPDAFGVAVRVAATLGFAIQIYADFSGYTDIARGIARGMGFRLSPNFRLPYFATDPRQFWQRWHITLSRWLRDYVYIPIGGNRGGPARVAGHLTMTMLLGGLWHGAAWNFVLWGGYHAALLIAHRWWSSRYEMPRRVAMATMFAATMVGWVIFRSPDLPTVVSMLQFGGRDSIGEITRWAAKLLIYAGPLVMLDYWMHRRGDMLIVLHTSPARQFVIMLLMIAAIVMLGHHGETSFLYFQF